VSAPAMAKGVEDTALYRFGRLLALNEVGGNPGCFGIAPEEFHARCAATAKRWPRTLLATSTHDTKRGEDVRARLALLSEMPERWAAAVRRWWAQNARHRRRAAPGGPGVLPEVPDAATEYMLYQTLVGAWPLGGERAAAYVEKAAREARGQTSWTRPDAAYEEGLRDFLAALDGDLDWQAELAEFVAPLIAPGRLNSLAETLLKLTAPGVPDVYQGCELWTLSLVDPDNRRPVDFALRRRLLERLAAASPEEILAGMEEGLPKLWLVRQALHLRRRRPEWFGPGAGYAPLAARGGRAGHAVVFCRAGAVVTVVPRLVLGLGGDWGDTEIILPEGAGVGEAGDPGERGDVGDVGDVGDAGERGDVGGLGEARGAGVVGAADDYGNAGDRGAAGDAGGGIGSIAPEGVRWRNVLTGEEWAAGPCRLAELLRRFPVALLARE
jgi:(1->4)-alpha-D-glucan 1-alpha-D-glucosylmutase